MSKQPTSNVANEQGKTPCEVIQPMRVSVLSCMAISTMQTDIAWLFHDNDEPNLWKAVKYDLLVCFNLKIIVCI